MICPVLETKRLILRPVALSDAPSYQLSFNNWNVIQNMGAGVPWPYADDGAVDFIQNSALPRMERGEAYIWGITLKDEGKLVGIVEFRVKPNENGHRGFWIAEHLWGQGYMSEATAAVNDFVFDILGYDYFIEENADFNEGSRAMKRKSGATLIETVEKPSVGGGTHICEKWHITRDGWNAAKASM